MSTHYPNQIQTIVFGNNGQGGVHNGRGYIVPNLDSEVIVDSPSREMMNGTVVKVDWAFSSEPGYTARVYIFVNKPLQATDWNGGAWTSFSPQNSTFWWLNRVLMEQTIKSKP